MARKLTTVIARVPKSVLWNAIVAKAHRELYINEASKISEFTRGKIGQAIKNAEGNATDTINDEYFGGNDMNPAEFEERFADLSYGSLSLTGAFDENSEVRDFFESIGYKW